ncbi:cytochrome c oxidase subunit 6a, mitochondrial-like [Elaeis guineensis]|uniref:Cytochrome c oxidase subunit 6a, mitochondrial-like n=1 Tax=Elaeis guineensis var. tenera TaxID=51953 RepID=A0A6I9QPI9_ELAGV|nr:cytochrome c oxidase subunit 6a, mitochondrial-like [Elaeis guineensis]
MSRSGLRATAVFRRGAKSGSHPVIPNKQSFSASAHHGDAYEIVKWEKITYAGIVTCTILSIYNLSKGWRDWGSERQPPPPFVEVRRAAPVPLFPTSRASPLRYQCRDRGSERRLSFTEVRRAVPILLFPTSKASPPPLTMAMPMRL